MALSSLQQGSYHGTLILRQHLCYSRVATTEHLLYSTTFVAAGQLPRSTYSFTVGYLPQCTYSIAARYLLQSICPTVGSSLQQDSYYRILTLLQHFRCNRVATTEHLPYVSIIYSIFVAAEQLLQSIYSILASSLQQDNYYRALTLL